MSEADEPAPLGQRYGLHIGLFVVTCATTFVAGSGWGDNFSLESGLAFGGALMLILLCHEMGHYVVARRHGIEVSLPYFIPLPPGITLGTLGAVIKMRSPISDRNKLIDVGAAGPIAGLVVAIPLLVVGLSLSELGPLTAEAALEGNSIAYLGLKFAVFGQYLPSADGVDVQLHALAFAAWVGLLITMINLIPIGQLDGGHIACAFLGDKHERFSARLHLMLLAVASLVVAVSAIEAAAYGRDVTAAIGYGLSAGLPWLVWAGLLAVVRRMSGGIYHPPVTDEPLTPMRRRLVAVMAVIFVLIFTPIPLREALV